MIAAAVAEATRLGAPVNVVVVDESGVDLAFVRMDGAKFLSIETARAKAQTSASHRRPSTRIPADIATGLAFASGGRITDMAGGLPVFIDGACVGGIGIGSASDEDDIAIARAALAAVGADEV
ncbi:heme-binding protein [Chenggangzhangella methanolivorans]|uniref:Heme-binding protein n=2 Tax=Chenggangzhangella methanolivorans TaxID=1437009 RepID=A0A9E6RJL4_9HYPH|nr:heme-binding protein [Chenggangzhangella methanolivorans]